MGDSQPVGVALLGAGSRGELDLGYFMEKNRKKIRYVAVAEPNVYRRKLFVEHLKIPEKNVFADWRDLVNAPRVADAVLNALPSEMHHEATIAALKAGYDVLLEKPMAHTPGECIHLARTAKKYGKVLAVVFENRYNRIYLKIKEWLDQGKIGQIMTANCIENIGWFHYANSYVRGIHHRSTGGNSFMIAKGIHDTDLLASFIRARVKRISTFGLLSYFNAQHAPRGAPQRCIEGCPAQDSCQYDAMKQYYKPGRPAIPLRLILGQSFSSYIDVLTKPRFRTLASAIVRDISKPNVLEALRAGPYGRCVFQSDNDVMDHQTTSMEFENGAICSLTLSGTSLLWERTLNFTGTIGEIMSRDFAGKLEIRTFNPARVRKQHIRFNGLHHGGGDEGLLLEFAKAVKTGNPQDIMTNGDNSVEPHLIAFAADEARLTNRVIEMDAFRRRAVDEADQIEQKN